MTNNLIKIMDNKDNLSVSFESIQSDMERKMNLHTF